MNHRYLFQLLLILSLLITFLSGRALYYDELDEEDRTKSSSSDEEGKQNEKLNKQNDFRSFLKKTDADSRLSNLDHDFSNFVDDRSYDSYEERQFYQRALMSSSHASHTISPHTRQAIIDILQKALDQGWRPNLKHYIPATRFGRHRR